MDRFYYYLKIIIGIILSISGIIAILFCSHFDGSIALNLIIFCSGLLSVFIGYRIVKYCDSHYIKKQKRELNLRIHRLMTTGLHKRISFKDLTVGGRSEIVEVPSRYPSKVIMLDGLYGIDRSRKTTIKDYSIIVYNEEIKGKMMQFFSPEVNKDSETLAFLLEKQRIIDLYIDKNNMENYYFDLKFLVK